MQIESNTYCVWVRFLFEIKLNERGLFYSFALLNNNNKKKIYNIVNILEEEYNKKRLIN